jgi:hypothetical protein
MPAKHDANLVLSSISPGAEVYAVIGTLQVCCVQMEHILVTLTEPGKETFAQSDLLFLSERSAAYSVIQNSLPEQDW